MSFAKFTICSPQPVSALLVRVTIMLIRSQGRFASGKLLLTLKNPMGLWPQPIDPLHGMALSATAAALPLAVVLLVMGWLRKPGYSSIAGGPGRHEELPLRPALGPAGVSHRRTARSLRRWNPV